MAEKRHLESVDTVSYSKLPRLEPELSQLHTADLCKSGVLSGHVSENHYNYKGSYFSYPVNYHEGPKSLTHWTPAEAYPHCTGSVANQQLQTEKALCMLYKHEAESFGARGQTLGHEKGSECISRDAFSTQERWASYMGYPGYVPQGWIHSYMAQQSPRVQTRCPSLAVPKPIYRHHVYSPKSGYSPKSSLDLGMPVESTLKLPQGTEWALPPLGPLSCTENPSYGMDVPKKAAVAETNFLALPPGAKDAATSTAGFSPYHKSFEKCQGGQQASFLDGNYPSTCSSHKTIFEAHGSNLSTHAWSKLPPPVNPLAHPPPLIYQDRSSTCYPLTSYPLTSHEQMLLYHQNYGQVEKPNSSLSLAACKGFGSSGSEEPPILPGSYFPPTPRSYHPGHLESYPYKLVGPPPMTPGLQKARNQMQQQCSSATKVDTPQKPPPAANAQPQKSPYCGSLPPRGWRKVRRVMEQTNKNFPSQQPAPQTEAVQPLSSLDQLPGFFDASGQMQETSCGAGLCSSEKAKSREKEPPHIPKWSTLNADVKKRNVDNHKTESGACIIIPDSPITPCSSYSKTDQAPNVSEDSNPSFQNGPQSPEERARGSITIPEMPPPPPPPPPSPPMPVINNVFSLAPYRDYLEGSSDSVEIPLSKTGQSEEISPSPKNTGKSMDGPPSAKPNCFRSSEVSGEKDVASSAMAEVSQKEPNSNCTGNKREGEECAGAWDSFQVKLLPPNGESVSSQPASKTCVNGWDGETEPDHGALDLSSKMESLVDIPSLQRESSKTNVGEVKERPSNGQEVLPETNRQALELPVQSSSERRCNFQSSTAFLFKKFKIRKSQATEADSLGQQNSPLSLLLSSQVTALSSNVPLQQHAEQVATRQKNPTLAHQEVSRQNSPTDGQSPCQGATRQNSSPVQQVMTQQTSPSIQHSGQQAVTQSEPQLLQLRCFTITLPDASKAMLPSTPSVSPVLKKAKVLPPASDESSEQRSSPQQYFTDLHTSICTIISCSVSTSSPEQLKEWLEKAESDQELKEKAASLAKPKNGVKAPNVPKPSKGKQVWLAFKDILALFRKLLYQLDTFLLTHNCPFPHVVRAGTIFIPIHVVKEKLFPNLSGTSVDHVLQDHKVELRPTTLSEEKLLRDLELKSCTSRMLKLLALKQLPDIYPDLLTLHWHDCVKQQLGDPAGEIVTGNSSTSSADDLKLAEVARCLQGTTTKTQGQNFRGKRKEERKWGSPPRRRVTCLPSKISQPVDDETSQVPSLPSVQSKTALKQANIWKEDIAAPLTSKAIGLPLHLGAKRQLLPAHKLPRTLQVQLTNKIARKTNSTSKVLHLRKSVVHIKFQNALRDIQGPSILNGMKKKGRKPPSLLLKGFVGQRCGSIPALPAKYPELVGKRIRHLFEEKDKTQAWYQGVVLRVHKRHKNPLKTVYEVKYDSEPDWQYYLEILQDYKKGWLELEE
ncbi:hypothetical protein JD844_014287 [Phrynosoma platyrhinos]|uniref:Uncharacterized protein n=1 Tax=Phrynosoma platyrhinos TaxID=52577 RepID=A0ABQ7SRE3_PHRPL|nr:hypothetical protein JD844_014287 [Phrynosoma platyrhinos]